MRTLAEDRRRQREQQEGKDSHSMEHPTDCVCTECNVQRAILWHRANLERIPYVQFSPFDSSTWGGQR